MSMFNLHFRFPSSWGFYKPGLEVKYALEESEKLGAKTYFLGPHFDKKTWSRLQHETRLNFTEYIYKRLQYAGNMFYGLERAEANARVQNSTGSQYSEKCLD